MWAIFAVFCNFYKLSSKVRNKSNHTSTLHTTLIGSGLYCQAFYFPQECGIPVHFRDMSWKKQKDFMNLSPLGNF
jgi:hypothetical protein